MNLIGMIGFSILNCILGGQALASVSDNNLSWTCVPCLLIYLFLVLNDIPQYWNRCHCCDITIGLILWVQCPELVCTVLEGLFATAPPFSSFNRYERLAWIPVFITFIIALGVGGKHLSSPSPPMPATPRSILSFASTLAGFAITYSPLSSDFTSYFKPNVSR